MSTSLVKRPACHVRHARRPPIVRGALLVTALLVGLLGPAATSASADPVDDLQAQARQIAQRLDELQRQSGALAEQFNAAQVRTEELKATIAKTRDRLAASRAERQIRRDELARYALGAYVNGGGTDDFDLVVHGKSDELGRRQGYTSAALGDRQQLIDRLQAAERMADDDLSTLEQAERDLAEQRATLLRKSQQAADLTVEQERIQAQVQGDLVDAVAEQQAQLAAEAEAAARARFGVPADAPSATAAEAPATTAPAGPATGPAGTPTTATTVPGAAPTVPAPSSPPASTSPPATTGPPATTAPPVTTAPPPPPPPPPASDGSLGRTVVNAAMAQQGVPYSWGGGNGRGPTLGFGPGANTVGFDCSGLTLYAWSQAGVSLARVAQSQYDTIRHIPMSSLQPGDLIFYGRSSRSIDHVSIYIGNGMVVHAPHTGAVVRTASLYLGGSFGWVGAGRPAG